jgi:galactose mutarotase-like enzyme
MALHTIDTGSLRISIDQAGAELSSVCDVTGRELLWQGQSVWKRRAPILFPIIGQMPGGLLHYQGVSYPIGQHGFARDQRFEVSVLSSRSVLFTLVDSLQTREQFPFRFRLEVLYSVTDATLSVTTTVTNTDSVPFAASLGAHPAFAWPLLPGIARSAHALEFQAPEPAPVRRIVDGLALVEPQPTPVVDRTLALTDSLFAADAIIFDQLASRSVRYSAPGAPAVVLDFPDFPLLGVWSKAPGEFVCIEPWFGMTAAQDFSGEYFEKPHQFVLEPNESREFNYSVTIEQPNP